MCLEGFLLSVLWIFKLYKKRFYTRKKILVKRLLSKVFFNIQIN